MMAHDVTSSLLFFAILYPILLFLFRDDTANKRKCLWIVLVFVAAGLSIKLVSKYVINSNLDMEITDDYTTSMMYIFLNSAYY